MVKHRRHLAAFLALALALAGLPLPAQTISNPDLFAKSLEAAQQTVEQYGRYDNEKELARVNRIGYELAQNSDFQKFPFTFTLVDMAEPNAVALPAGQIFVTRGLLDLGLTDDMLATVLGHEMGHVVLEHYLHMDRRSTLMSVLGNLLLAGVIIGAERSSSRQSSAPQAPYDPRVGYESQAGNRIEGVAAANLILSELLLRSYSRENEDAADQEGQRFAAAAGYDPDGARQMWVLMSSRAPEAKEFGYWRTHPFPDERIRAAEARKQTWKIQAKRPADSYRLRTQAVLMSYLERQRSKLEGSARGRRPPEKPLPGEVDAAKAPVTVASFLKDAALATWPQGKVAESIRLERLHAQRDQQLAKPLLARDYGSLVRAYQQQREVVRLATPDSEFLATVASELADFDRKLKELYPRAVSVFKGGVYETAFLSSFLSNFPAAREVPEVALALGDAYSRLGNETDAVTQYLAAEKAAPDSGEGRRARAGLRNLAPNLKELAALQQLVDQNRDTELKRLAAERLDAMAKSYDDVANGAEYLRRFPTGPHLSEVIARLNVLADNLYGEVVLYQGVGDSTKALERINKILTNAPLSPAAEKLRDRAVLVAQRGA